MLHEGFYWIFNMSITASVTGAVVMLLRLWKKIPKRVTFFLFAIPFMRMVLPFGLNSPYSLMTLISKFTTKTVVVHQPTEDVAVSATNHVMAAVTYFPITYKVDLLEEVFSVASVIWVIVFSAIVLTMVVVYVTTMHEMKDARHLHGHVYCSDKILSPAVYGIIKPRIILPVSYDHENVEMILLHEKMHIRRADNLWRMMAFLLTSVHWFNPLCWIILKLFLRDMELSCDERVLAVIGEERKKEYAYALVESNQSKTVFTSAFGGAEIRTRIDNILSFRKMTWLSLAGFAALSAGVFYVLLTNAG